MIFLLLKIFNIKKIYDLFIILYQGHEPNAFLRMQ